jgi:hypothetical protein
MYNATVLAKGKPAARRGRKATGLTREEVAGLPKGANEHSDPPQQAKEATGKEPLGVLERPEDAALKAERSMNHIDIPRVSDLQRAQAVLLLCPLASVAVARVRGVAVRVVGDAEHE